VSSSSSVAIVVGGRLGSGSAIYLYIYLSINIYLRGVGEQQQQRSDRRGRQARVRQCYLSIYLPIYQYIPPRGG